ncbi:T3SS effector NleG family protein [Salmonella enterica subsp. enterica serovar London]|nr:DUF1076 domain-containing protein [Salmonella enterica]EBI0478778.1 DUF1076 domain-containing protein [Salmonella enterica subsp. enterica serovar Braenderup]ECI4704079.1 hypothetical protein [Salmonella enterica subsp. salamae]EDV3123767.1 DUF1076 domain-containing protein [Salmonella enterica subsp. enterica]EIR0426880.1 T3SS effector NleG family protein [Salmonella enterica subsp. enterica serovar London]
MPPVFITLPVNEHGNVLPISSHDLGNIRGAAQHADDAVNVQMGNGLYRVRYLPRLDSFSVNPNTGFNPLHSAMEFITTVNNSTHLEEHLNQGRTFLSALEAALLRCQSRISTKIDSCSFSMERENFSLAAEHLTCPIALSIPERGVFARTSLQSDVCCLYDPAALKELVSRRLPHPISREAITGAHIVPKEQCHFDPEKGAFIHSASESR